MRPMHRDILLVADTLDELLDKMAAHTPVQAIIHMSSKDL
jgi:hypothetical protein